MVIEKLALAILYFTNANFPKYFAIQLKTLIFLNMKSLHKIFSVFITIENVFIFWFYHSNSVVSSTAFSYLQYRLTILEMSKLFELPDRYFHRRHKKS